MPLPLTAAVLATAAALAADGGSPGPKPPKKTPLQYEEEAIACYGETSNPISVGFLFSDGRWLDFSEGSGGIRSQDHRNVAHLLPDEERADEQEYGAQTLNMNRWMDLAHVIRVSGTSNYALLDLPSDKTAVLAVLSSLSRRSIQRYLRGLGRDVSIAVGLPDDFRPEDRSRRVDFESYEVAGSLPELFDEIVSWAKS